MAVAAFLGDEVTDSKKSRCLHPDKPAMFACSDCPRRSGKCSDEPQMAVASFLAEEVADSKKIQMPASRQAGDVCLQRLSKAQWKMF